MSEQKTSNAAYYAKLTGVLLIISLAVAALLGVVNGMTADIIAEAKSQSVVQKGAEEKWHCPHIRICAGKSLQLRKNERKGRIWQRF